MTVYLFHEYDTLAPRPDHCQGGEYARILRLGAPERGWVRLDQDGGRGRVRTFSHVNPANKQRLRLPYHKLGGGSVGARAAIEGRDEGAHSIAEVL